jgi:ABC-2 type transport system ATP-binding protein
MSGEKSVSAAIELEGARKVFRVRERTRGVAGALRGLVSRRTREVVAVDDVSFAIAPGERVAFVGPNGAGKSTTLKMLAGILRPTAGRVRVAGLEPGRERRLGFKIGAVFGQRSQLWTNLPALDTFDLLARIYELSPAEYRARRDELVRAFEIEEIAQKPVRQLSLGERMRCELVASLLHRPEILFLDEPTIGLDVVAQYNVQTFLRHYQESRRITILLTSHYMKDVAALCRRVVVIALGRIIYDGSLAGIVDRFGGHKVISLEMADGRVPGDLARFGEVISLEPPRVKLRVERGVVPEVLGRILAAHAVEDVSVEDPPLEQVIAEMFASSGTSLEGQSGQ